MSRALVSPKTGHVGCQKNSRFSWTDGLWGRPAEHGDAPPGGGPIRVLATLGGAAGGQQQTAEPL